MNVTPRSVAVSRIRVEVGSSDWPAKVMVPRQISETFKPVRPNRRCFIAYPSQWRPRRWATSMDDPTPAPNPLDGWKSLLVADLERVALRDRWGLGLMALGRIPLAVFVVCQALSSAGKRRDLPYLALWASELAVNLWVFRKVAGRGWHRSTPLAGIIVRVWATFLILSFNAASLNTLTGWALDWFKLVWTSLSTFGFATMAYLISPWFFVPAVQMYLTGLLMSQFPGHHYLIYGVSWCATLQGIGWAIEHRRGRRAKPRSHPSLSLRR